MTKADELWEKYAKSWRDGERYMSEHDFLAALAGYGEAVRAEAVKVCKDKRHPDDFTPESGQWFMACEDCAAAIEKMKLP
jgi:uncharacterized lipoprotein NlpE involved in copper resistance